MPLKAIHILVLTCFVLLIVTICIPDFEIQFQWTRTKRAKSSQHTPPRNCTPVTKISFAKTHKTGGSTLQNILLRYGFKHGHRIALPHKHWFFSLENQFKADMVANFSWSKNRKFDIIASHSLWDPKEVDKVIGKPSVKFSLLRDPVDAFESGFVYMGIGKYHKSGTEIDINEYANQILMLRYPQRAPKAHFDVGESLWDLGLSNEKLKDQQAVSNKILELENQLDLILISERFDESLILLKDKLCWNLEDVAYIRQNERTQKHKSKMTSKTREILREWLWADYQLYIYFKEKFEKTIGEIDTTYLQSELEQLQYLNNNLKEKCQAEVVDNESLKGKKGHMANDMVKAYTVIENCTYYVISEPSFFNAIRKTYLLQASSKPTPQPIW